MVILTCTAILVLYGKIRNKLKNMVLFYHIKKRCNRMYTKRNVFTNEMFEMNIIHENVH